MDEEDVLAGSGGEGEDEEEVVAGDNEEVKGSKTPIEAAASSTSFRLRLLRSSLFVSFSGSTRTRARSALARTCPSSRAMVATPEGHRWLS